jgi:epoxyqueuosine reductase
MAIGMNTDQLKTVAQSLGFDTCGVAPAVSAPHEREYRQWLDKGFHGTMGYLSQQLLLKQHPENLLPGVRSVIAVSLNYNQPNEPEEGQPRIARYALGRDYHKVLRGKLRKLASWIEEKHPGTKSRPCVDSAPIFERDYARLAGLGWFGKNTMLIDSKRGSWFFIGLLLTTAEFETDEPSMGGCGTCTRCIDACPTGAIVFDENHWQVDARKCVSYLTIEHNGVIAPELAPALKNWTFGCDVCQEVCPFNEPRDNAPLRAQETREPDFLTHREWPSLAEMAELPYQEWDELTRGSAVRRTGLEGLQRNARLAIEPRDR